MSSKGFVWPQMISLFSVIKLLRQYKIHGSDIKIPTTPDLEKGAGEQAQSKEQRKGGADERAYSSND